MKKETKRNALWAFLYMLTFCIVTLSATAQNEGVPREEVRMNNDDGNVVTTLLVCEGYVPQQRDYYDQDGDGTVDRTDARVFYDQGNQCDGDHAIRLMLEGSPALASHEGCGTSTEMPDWGPVDWCDRRLPGDVPIMTGGFAVTDNELNVGDVLFGLRASVGLITDLTSEQRKRLDLAPFNAFYYGSTGYGDIIGDDNLDVADVLANLRQVVGLLYLDWPERKIRLKARDSFDAHGFDARVGLYSGTQNWVYLSGVGYGQWLFDDDQAIVNWETWQVATAYTYPRRTWCGDLMLTYYYRAIEPLQRSLYQIEEGGEWFPPSAYNGPVEILIDFPDFPVDGASMTSWLYTNQEDVICAVDSDFDGVPDTEDNCPESWNRYQEDNDEDGLGNRCDLCIDVAFDEQIDTDEDLLGDECDPDPLDPDSDDDGASDGVEVLYWGTDPLDPDTDDDGYNDDDEVHKFCTDPLVADSDSDGDGVPDETERIWDEVWNIDGINLDGPNTDTDGDLIPDIVEEDRGTDPLDPDSWPQMGKA